MPLYRQRNSAATTEGSLIGHFVAILTPICAIVAGWVAGWVAQIVPGAHLDPSQIVAFMLAAATTVLTSGWKWLQGWQQHERLVAAGRVAPRVPMTPDAQVPLQPEKVPLSQ